MRKKRLTKCFQKPLWPYSILAISIAFSHQPVIAAQNTNAALDEVEEVYVTGSRIIRKDLESASPVTVIDATQIKVSGATSVADVLQALPSMVGNAVTTSTTNGGGAGAADVTLRGLPSQQTLVLLNGRRMPNDGVTGVTPDLNMIPFAAVEQVEVLKDGASAIYGSDAIAGVVNIKLKKNFEGLVLNTYGGLSSREDYPKQAIDITYGSNFDRGNLLVSLSYYDQGTIQASDRKVSATANNLSFLYAPGHSFSSRFWRQSKFGQLHTLIRRC
jgi:iron complex outermembrane receptor protein